MAEKFEWYLDEDKVYDSMCYDSGTQICTYGTEDNYINVVVRGYVTVDYKDDRYWHASEMPDELIQMFRDGTAYDWDDEKNEVITLENNWLEFEVIKDGENIDGDVLEVGTPATKEEMEKVCKDVWQQWNKELKLGKVDNDAN